MGAGREPLPPIAGEEKDRDAAGEAPPPPFLDPHTYKSCPLIEKEMATHDTRRLRFGCVKWLHVD
jgi:hypothetical protein